MYENHYKSAPDTSLKNPKNLKENIIVKVFGNSAWVICDNTWKGNYNNVPEKTTNIQIAFFEKINGKWKFSFNAFVQKPEPEAKAGPSK